MQLINWSGALFGPGSEWFWAFAQFVVVVVSLVGIYYQLRLARSANAFEQLSRLQEQWESERMLRHRLATYLALRDGGSRSNVPPNAAYFIADFWESLGALTRAGHVDPRLVKETYGLTCRSWWWILGPLIDAERVASGDPTVYAHFEWVADRMYQLGYTVPIDQAFIDRGIEERIASTQASIKDLETMRR